jgi:hypothetical protein
VTGSSPRHFLNDLGTGLKDLASALHAMAVASSFKTDALAFRLAGLADHMPVYYATLLWNALVAKA